jgi:hypothetical protein
MSRMKLEARHLKKLSASILAIALAGCAGNSILPPNAAPTIEQIAYRGATYAVANGMDPKTYMRVGMLMARDQCLQYFDRIVQAQDKRTFASSELNLLGGIGMGAAMAAGAAVPAVAGIGLASSLAQGTLTNAAIATGAGAFPEETAGLILDKAMGTYVAALPEPKTIVEADVYVHGLASYCSSTKIHQLMRDAISSAQMTVMMPLTVPPPTIATPITSSIEPAPAPLTAPPMRRPPRAVPKAPPTPPPSPAPPPRAYPPSLLRWGEMMPPVIGVVK